MMRPIHLTVAATAILALAACDRMAPERQMAAPAAAPAQQSAQQETMVWVRTDGQRGSGNPELERQYQTDTQTCLRGEVVTAEARACMEGRGYAYVPRSQADATLRYFASRSGNG